MIALPAPHRVFVMNQPQPKPRLRRKKRLCTAKSVTTTTCENVGRKPIPEGTYTATWDKYSVKITLNKKPYEVLSDERGPLASKAILTIIDRMMVVTAQEYDPKTPKFVPKG